MEVAGNVAGQQGRLPREPGASSPAISAGGPTQGVTTCRSSPPKSLSGVAPKLVELTDNVLFRDVWERPGLFARDRCLITVTTLAALHCTEQLGYHLKLALENGLSQQELAEVITHLAFYAGWPIAMTAITQLKGVVEETGGPAPDAALRGQIPHHCPVPPQH
jgi:4-carboxymuconolactone decarboxylase